MSGLRLLGIPLGLFALVLAVIAAYAPGTAYADAAFRSCRDGGCSYASAPSFSRGSLGEMMQYERGQPLRNVGRGAARGAFQLLRLTVRAADRVRPVRRAVRFATFPVRYFCRR